MSQQEPAGLSVTTVVVLVFCLTSFLAWGVLAASYTGGTKTATLPPQRDNNSVSIPVPAAVAVANNSVQGVLTFLATAFVQLPNFFAVLSWHATQRLWLLILAVLAPAAVLAGGVGMKRLEKHLAAPIPRKRR